MSKIHLLMLAAEADRARIAPYLDALRTVYPTCDLYFPMTDPLANGITEKVENTKAAIFFVSDACVNDPLLRAVITNLTHTDIPLLVCHLDEIDLPAGLQFELSLCPEFYPNRHDTLASAVDTLKNAPYIKKAFSL